MSKLAKAPDWQRDQALIIHREFLALESAVASGAKVGDRLKTIAVTLTGIATGTKKKLVPSSFKTLERKLTLWRKNGRSAEALLPGYRRTVRCNQVPPELISEFQTKCTKSSGGRDKHGKSPLSVAYRSLVKDWRAGRYVPGLGTWKDWWELNPATSHLPTPSSPPEFPFAERSLRKYQPADAIRARGNIGASAAKNKEAFIERDYSKLRRCELYTLDDCRLDFVAIDEPTGKVEEVCAYVLQEVASRMIVAFIVKPRHAIKQEDVDELIAHGLQADGFGIGVGYTTHFLFERGTVACSEAAQLMLEEGSGGRIKVRRTGIVDGVRWIGAAPDRAKGNAAAKGTVESFIRRLHFQLLDLPGQRGNRFENAPENLGFARNHEAYRPFLDEEKEENRANLTVTSEAERLAQFNRRALGVGINAKLDLPLLTFGKVREQVKAAIDFLNNDRGHDYQGHGTIQQVEVAKGVWRDING